MAAVPTATSAYVLAVQMGAPGAPVALLISTGTIARGDHAAAVARAGRVTRDRAGESRADLRSWRPRVRGRSAPVAPQEVGDDALLGAVDRRVQRAIGRVELLRLAKGVDGVLVQSLRLQRLAEAPPRVGVGELEIGPRPAQLGRAPIVARAQQPRPFALQRGRPAPCAPRTARRDRRRWAPPAAAPSPAHRRRPGSARRSKASPAG